MTAKNRRYICGRNARSKLHCHGNLAS